VQVVSSVEDLRECLADWRHHGDHVALVPTSGNIHEGSLSLVRLAREHAERVIVSVFAGSEDGNRAPASIERDKRRLKRENVDLIFMPDSETMYPFGTDNSTSVTVPVLTSELCGSMLPGHFDGVTTMMSKLFSLVQPDVAVFGQKDFQQQLVIRRMVTDLNMPIRIVSGPIVREGDGLAKSLRNQDMSDDERAIAPELYAAISGLAEAIASGDRSFADLESAAMNHLEKAGFEPEYVSVRRAATLEPADPDNHDLVVLAAARLGGVRLIDNVEVSI
jgi:pantoate--beta-alanine ligase